MVTNYTCQVIFLLKAMSKSQFIPAVRNSFTLISFVAIFFFYSVLLNYLPLLAVQDYWREKIMDVTVTRFDSEYINLALVFQLSVFLKSRLVSFLSSAE